MKKEYETPTMEVFSFETTDTVMDGCGGYTGATCPYDGGECSLDINVGCITDDSTCWLDEGSGCPLKDLVTSGL